LLIKRIPHIVLTKVPSSYLSQFKWFLYAFATASVAASSSHSCSWILTTLLCSAIRSNLNYGCHCNCCNRSKLQLHLHTSVKSNSFCCYVKLCSHLIPHIKKIRSISNENMPLKQFHYLILVLEEFNSTE